jgi:hypothetical protein
MARQAWALARAWPKTFFFVWKKKTEKNIGKRAKWANQQSEHNLKTSFTLSLSLLSRATHTDTVTHSNDLHPVVPCSTTTPQSPPEKLQTPVHNRHLSLSAQKSPFTNSMEILEYYTIFNLRVI